MPIIIGLKQASELEKGTLIPCLRAQITAIYEHKTGTKADGSEWSVQTIELKGDGLKLKGKVWDHQPLPKSLNGKMCLFTAAGKKGAAGVYADEDDYKTITKQIKITGTGTIEPECAPGPEQEADDPGQSDGPPDESHDSAPATPPPAKPETKPASQPAPASNKDQVHSLWATMYRVTMEGAKCRAAFYQANPEIPWTDEQFRAFCCTVFIQLHKY